MDLLSVQGLCKQYEQFSLQDVSFTVRPGEIMGFIGRNGAGKTTTLKSLLNFVHPDCGEISFFGLPFAQNEQAIKQRIGFVSGGVDYYILKKLRTIADVTRAFYPTWDETVYRHFLQTFQLNDQKTPSQLSAGMPLWLVDRFTSTYGEEMAEQIILYRGQSHVVAALAQWPVLPPPDVPGISDGQIAADGRKANLPVDTPSACNSPRR